MFRSSGKLGELMEVFAEPRKRYLPSGVVGGAGFAAATRAVCLRGTAEGLSRNQQARHSTTVQSC